MPEAQACGVERLAWEVDRSKRVRTVRVARLPDKRVAVYTRLQPDLITSARHETDFEQRRLREAFHCPVVTLSILAAWISGMRRFLPHRVLVPEEAIVPVVLGRRWV